jgi:SPP1 gp7 family putative phage head morphogenesis protein
LEFKPNKRIEAQYYRDILGIVRKYFLDPFGKVHAAFITLPEWLEKFAHQAAERMVLHTLAENARDWRTAALESGQGPRVYQALQRELKGKTGDRYRQLIAQNAQFITTLPQSVASQFVKEAARYQREGIRAEDLAFHSKLLQHVTKAQAMRLARTESAKASAALTQARAEDLGLQWYVWQTSQDQRVRQGHRKMQGVLVNFEDPPSPEELVNERSYGHYNAGNIFNCRCYMEPLLRLDQVKWPHRIYAAGAIRYVTLAQFRNKNAALAA